MVTTVDFGTLWTREPDLLYHGHRRGARCISLCIMFSDGCIVASKRAAQFVQRLKTEKKITFNIFYLNHIAVADLCGFCPFNWNFLCFFDVDFMSALHMTLCMFTLCLLVYQLCGLWAGAGRMAVPLMWKGAKATSRFDPFSIFSLPLLFFFSLLFFFIPLSRETRGVRWGGKVHVDGDIQAQIKGPRGLRGCSFSGWLSPPCLCQLHSKHTLAKSATAGGKAASLALSLSRLCQIKCRRGHRAGTEGALRTLGGKWSDKAHKPDTSYVEERKGSEADVILLRVFFCVFFFLNNQIHVHMVK